MPSTEIRSYRVGVFHRAAGDFSRYLALQPVAGHQGGGSGGIWLYFADSAAPSASERGEMIVATLPEGLFADMYHVVQTEKPAYFVWETAARDGMIRSCGISTGPEPAGEGWHDASY